MPAANPPFVPLSSHRARHAPPPARCADFLAIDGEPDVLLLARKILGAEGFSMETAASVGDAVRLIKEGGVIPRSVLLWKHQFLADWVALDASLKEQGAPVPKVHLYLANTSPDDIARARELAQGKGVLIVEQLTAGAILERSEGDGYLVMPPAEKKAGLSKHSNIPRMEE